MSAKVVCSVKTNQVLKSLLTVWEISLFNKKKMFFFKFILKIYIVHFCLFLFVRFEKTKILSFLRTILVVCPSFVFFWTTQLFTKNVACSQNFVCSQNFACSQNFVCSQNFACSQNVVCSQKQCLFLVVCSQNVVCSQKQCLFLVVGFYLYIRQEGFDSLSCPFIQNLHVLKNILVKIKKKKQL